MTNVVVSEHYDNIVMKLDTTVRRKIAKQLRKICEMPEIGKPMMHDRKDTREVYVGAFRLSYR